MAGSDHFSAALPPPACAAARKGAQKAGGTRTRAQRCKAVVSYAGHAFGVDFVQPLGRAAVQKRTGSPQAVRAESVDCRRAYRRVPVAQPHY